MMKEIQRKETRHERGANTDVATGAGIDAAEVRHVGPTVGSKPPADLVAKWRLVKFGHGPTSTKDVADDAMRKPDKVH
jgi:hypothetical protein